MPEVTNACAAPGCDRPAAQTAYCWAHYTRLRRYGEFDPPITRSDRFWSRVEFDAPGECWTFPTGRRDGYGIFGKTYTLAHRFAYEDVVGPIPQGLTLDHICRVRNCVNPDHLDPVTQRINTLRGIGITAMNAAKTHCPRGHSYDFVNAAGQRGCRTCAREASRRHNRSRRGGAPSQK